MNKGCATHRRIKLYTCRVVKSGKKRRAQFRQNRHQFRKRLEITFQIDCRSRAKPVGHPWLKCAILCVASNCCWAHRAMPIPFYKQLGHIITSHCIMHILTLSEPDGPPSNLPNSETGSILKYLIAKATLEMDCYHFLISCQIF